MGALRLGGNSAKSVSLGVLNARGFHRPRPLLLHLSLLGESVPVALQGLGPAWGLWRTLLAARAAEIALGGRGSGAGGLVLRLGDTAEWGRAGRRTEAAAEHAVRGSRDGHDGDW